MRFMNVHDCRSAVANSGRVRTRAFAHLQSHYLFCDRFGRPGKGNDKGEVEALVKTTRRPFMVFMVPIPVGVNLQIRLTGKCRVDRWRQTGSNQSCDPKSRSWLPVRSPEALVNWGHERIERDP